MIDIVHSAVEAVATVVPIVLYMWSNKRRAKHDTEKRHEENRQKLDELVSEGRNYPPHMHTEKRGPLTVDGVKYPPPRSS